MDGEGMMMEIDLTVVEEPRLLDPPTKSDPLAKNWNDKISKAREHWSKFHQRIEYNRKVVSGFDWSRNPKSSDFYVPRANLIVSTITSLLSGIYARNPEISVTPEYANVDLKLFCTTLEKVINKQLTDAKLKERMKSTVRAAMTVSFGAIKVTYQRNYKKDPIILQRIDDAQDNIARAEKLAAELNDPDKVRDQELVIEQLNQTVAALNEKIEVVDAEGIVIDRIRTEDLLIDPACKEFEDYPYADWIAQIVPMKRGEAEAEFGYKLNSATKYRPSTDGGESRKISLFRGSGSAGSSDDEQICVIEVWDKQSQRVYTFAEGCDFFLREPYSPSKTGERWYPFFLLPFTQVDGEFIGPSLVDLTEKLQEEYNATRDKYNDHRDLIKPGYIASGDINEKSLRRFADSELGEITLIESDGMPVQQAIMPKSYPPIDPAVYDTMPVRQDWEQVTGLQDANRGNVVEAKTATEARIMQQGLSTRVAEFRDKTEDFASDVANYAGQILIQELTPQQVERTMGPPKTGPKIDENTGMPVIDPITGMPVMEIIEPSYEWPALSKDQVFDMVQINIRAGTTGHPDTLEQQENWNRLLPQVTQMIQGIMQLQQQGLDTGPFVALLRETFGRYNEKVDVDSYIPKPQQPQQGAMGSDMPNIRQASEPQHETHPQDALIQ